MRRFVLVTVVALGIGTLTALPSDDANAGPGKVLEAMVANFCTLDTIAGRVAAWYYDVKFEGGAWCE